MKDLPEPEPLTPEDELFLKHLLGAALDLGAEEYWMQDIRCAMRAINDERARLRAARLSGSSE